MAKRYASGIWNFYDVDVADESIANCNIPVCSEKTRKIRRSCAACFPYDVSHTSESIAKTIHMIVSDWKLKEKIHLIMRDNALNMVRAMTDNNFSNASCFFTHDPRVGQFNPPLGLNRV